jgi:hypothetical protein
MVTRWKGEVLSGSFDRRPCVPLMLAGRSRALIGAGTGSTLRSSHAVALMWTKWSLSHDEIARRPAGL